ncbi:MAG: hypothetical protein JKX81_02765 [Arenicella sp.]|nr:hypothetical protein [Arenicella sp.]
MIITTATRFSCIVFATALTVVACSEQPSLSDEDKVRATLNAIEVAAEQRSLSSMLEHISSSYRDYEGNDYKKIQSIMQFQLIKNQSINIFSKIRELQIVGDAATVEMSVAMASRNVDLSSQSNRLRADTHRFSILLVREKQNWKIQSVSWQRGW